MDYRAIIDFNKYTLALASGGLLYAFGLLPKLPDYRSEVAVFGTLFLFLAAAVCGIIIFAAATKALHHADEPAKNEQRDKIIRGAGAVHSLSLFLAVLALGIVMIAEAYAGLGEPPQKPDCSCCQCQKPSQDIRPRYWPAGVDHLAL